MPKLIIVAGGSRNTYFELDKPALIGRTSDCDLVLDDPSVSRRHARITLDSNRYFVEDLDSFNGVLVNGEKDTKQEFRPDDEIRIGRFTLAVLADGEQFYKGRAVAYMWEHSRTTTNSSQETRNISEEESTLLDDQRRVINGGRIRSVENPDNYWFPEDRKITFGGNAMVEIRGFWLPPIVAEVAWDGTAHVLRRLARRAKVAVNGSSVTAQVLSDGDTLTLGKSSFQYKIKS